MSSTTEPNTSLQRDNENTRNLFYIQEEEAGNKKVLLEWY